MKKIVIMLVVALAAVSVAVTAAFAQGSANKDFCVLLPDSKSSIRWETQDRPSLVKAFNAAKVSYVITNADNDAQKQKTQADQCLANGAKVVILAPLDSGSGLAIEKAAAAKGAKVIEYDRQVNGSKGVVYVSFDGAKVGVLQGNGVVAGLKKNGKYSQKPVVAELNGGQTDPNAFLFKSGYDSILKPLYKKGVFVKGPDQFTPGWDNQKARLIFDQMLAKTSNKIDAVAAANDGLANAVVTALKAKKLKPIPLSGQDATGPGVQNIISGWQTMTVWKDTRLLAAKAAAFAIALSKGQTPKTNTVVKNGSAKQAAYIYPPVAITKANFRQLFNGYLKKSEVCVGVYAKYCVKPA
ncbi:substrate-binding domain-containing protein [Gaiella sp.]|uniref:sugar ABC transporter substrate-binding protein n=1 Tax=Gaiella sp. TaxID=2663207 RepID=UPI003267F783